MNPSERSDALTLTPGDVAERLDISREAALKLMQSGAVRAVNIARGGREHWRTCEDWLADPQSLARAHTVSLSHLGAVGRSRECPVHGLEFQGSAK